MGGVGKTTLVYHLAYMFAEMGRSVLAADLDPQANLTSMFLDEDRLIELWPNGSHRDTIHGAIEPMVRGIGDIKTPRVEKITRNITLIPGDLQLSNFEDKLPGAWPDCLSRDEAAFRITTAFYRVILRAAENTSAEIVLLDVGPNLGAINRAALIAASNVVVPLAADLFSLQGLRNLGPQLIAWRQDWKERLAKANFSDLPLPEGRMSPAGYVVMQHAVRADRPVKAYLRWMEKIPNEYRQSVLQKPAKSGLSVRQDPHCLASLRHYRSLMPLAQEARKPMFALKPADGAIGAHVEAVRDCYRDFKSLANRIIDTILP